MKPTHLLDALPTDLASEVFEDIVRSSTVRIERIVSHGHASPDCRWYDQEENEWVMVFQGRASLEFEDGSRYDLSPGDYLNIPAHAKHRVAWTTPDEPTVWLAVFYKPE